MFWTLHTPRQRRVSRQATASMAATTPRTRRTHMHWRAPAGALTRCLRALGGTQAEHGKAGKSTRVQQQVQAQDTVVPLLGGWQLFPRRALQVTTSEGANLPKSPHFSAHRARALCVSLVAIFLPTRACCLLTLVPWSPACTRVHGVPLPACVLVRCVCKCARTVRWGASSRGQREI